MKNGEYGNDDDAEINRKDMCDPSQTPEHEKWEQGCTRDNQSNRTDSVLNSRRAGEDPEDSWYMCQTDMDMAVLHNNISSSGITQIFKVELLLLVAILAALPHGWHCHSVC